MSSRADFLNLDVSLAVGVGAEKGIGAYTDKKGVQIAGSFTATCQVQISLFKTGTTNFINIGSALTAPGYVAIPEIAQRIRIDTTAYTAGTPLAIFGGERIR